MSSGFWRNWLGHGKSEARFAGRPRPLRIAAQGMCCAVGHNAPAAAAAIRARLDHFRETDFVSDGGHPVVGASLYEVHSWGIDRLRAMLYQVLAECLRDLPRVPTSSIALVILTSEAQRPGPHHEWMHAEVGDIVDNFSQAFHRHSHVGGWGKAGIADALHGINFLFQEIEAPTHVILVGVDSLLNAMTIEHLREAERLATPDNADGLIPGEGAAAIVLTPAACDRAALWIESAAVAHDEWRLGSDRPMRAAGLSEAIRQAANQAGTRVADLDFHASGMTGESWCAKEASLALSRCIEQRVTSFPQEVITRNTGEIGAASAPMTLAWLSQAMAREDGPGKSALLHFSDDDGRRAAMVVKYR
jgi:3-oxoacyl-[acyl-carrier-protein] synthase-1